MRRLSIPSIKPIKKIIPIFQYNKCFLEEKRIDPKRDVTIF